MKVKKVDFENFIKHVIEEHMSEQESEVEIATLKEETIKDFKQMKKAKANLMDEMELAQAEIEVQIKRLARERLGPIKEALDGLHDDFWGKVYKDYNLDPNESYSIDTSEKKLLQVVDIPNPPKDGMIN